MNLFVALTQLEEILDNISELLEQISSNISKSTFAEGFKYAFYDDNGKQFIIDNVRFGEEKELADVFNSNSASLSNITTMEMGSYNKTFHFKPTPKDATPDKDKDLILCANFEEEER
ncbi:hypothetical protein TNIN_399141 [Trichonephila inaurata madagascariensis]|uniref:Uncharacterized protein n=1 Tax=Trichonephila inaurata madagascariensis TaxID=2747483 RepID=A0A8X6XQH5_9ARAC|nr:hypothetical protein TNIN_399141 [Trichonephila inaurata madagascariensis]